MKRCASCNSPMEDNAKFCLNCGAVYLDAPRGTFCGICGAEIIEGTPFCPSCGAPAGGMTTVLSEAYAPFTASPTKSKKRTLAVALIAVVVVLAAAAAAIFGLGLIGGDDEEEKTLSSSRKEDEDEEEKEKEEEEEETTGETTGETTEETTGETIGETTEETTEAIADVVTPVYINELTPSAQNGKIWYRGPDAVDYDHDTKDEIPGCWADETIPGYTEGGMVDNMGNTYSYGLFLDGSVMRSFSISYQVNGKYTVFCGTCACPGKDYAVGPKAYGDTVYTKYFEIYGDGVLLFTSETMTRDSDPQYFEIDITGVTLLTIQYPATSGPNELATLCDGMLK